MRPLVAKVKVGDVLYGTRNLRSYLRTASLLQRVEAVANGVTESRLKKVYAPSKDDEFVVAVNAWGNFGVWCARENLMLLWINPEKTRVAQGLEALRMTPAHFAYWFVRTKGRKPDLREWPPYAYNLWVYLQLNAIASNGGQSGLQLPGHDKYQAFNGHAVFQGAGARVDVQNYGRAAIKRGLTRPKLGGMTSVTSGRGCGPSTWEVKEMEKSLREYLSNPRVRRKVTESGVKLGNLHTYEYIT